MRVWGVKAGGDMGYNYVCLCIYQTRNTSGRQLLTMECPRYSVTFSEMYSSFPSFVVLNIKPFTDCNHRIQFDKKI